MKRTLNRKGFSLVELMVVVAIIGILSAIAIPNFQRFQRKARQSEAKAHLTGIYTAEKAFFAEWNEYFSDLDVVGYRPDGRLMYGGGFPGASVLSSGNMLVRAAIGNPGYPIGYTGSLATGNSTLAAVCGAAGSNCQMAPGAPGAPAAAMNPAGGAGATGTFIAGVATTAALLGGMTNDEWVINQNKELVNTLDGIP